MADTDGCTSVGFDDVDCGRGASSPGGYDKVGESDGPTGIGHSVVVGPDGTRLAELGYTCGYVTATIDADRLDSVRQSIPVLGAD